MEENFNVIAQSRANYYTPGSPVQFVRIEVLQGDQSGENAICLTFKNIAPAVITRLCVTFKCKDATGAVLCENAFEYEDLQIKSGELFGMEDAVFVTTDKIGSADVVLEKVYSGKKVMTLSQTKRVRLPVLQKLEEPVAKELAMRIGRDDLKYMPQLLEAGWYCACGAFHPKEENTVYCSECSSDRILLQNTIQVITQPNTVSTPVVSEDPTVVSAAPSLAQTQPEQVATEQTKMFVAPELPKEPVEDATVQVNVPKQAVSENIQKFAKIYQEDQAKSNARYDDDSYGDYDPEEEEDPRDIMAENLIRWVPAVTVLLCAGIALAGFSYCTFVL